MEPLSLLVIMSLVAYRLTRLVVKDSFPPVQRLRDWLVGADEEKLYGTRLEWFGELITCYWCSSFWIAGLVVGATEVVVDVPLPFLMWWAVAGVAAFVSYVEDCLGVWSDANMKKSDAFDRDRRAELAVMKKPSGY